MMKFNKKLVVMLLLALFMIGNSTAGQDKNPSERPNITFSSGASFKYTLGYVDTFRREYFKAKEREQKEKEDKFKDEVLTRLDKPLITHGITPFIDSPALSLRRVRICAPKYSEDGTKNLRLFGVNNKGDRLYGHRDDFHPLKGQRIVFQKNDVDQKHVHCYLPNGWRLDEWPPISGHIVALSRAAENGTLLIGGFDIITGSIHEIGVCADNELIIAVNCQSAIVLGRDKFVYWICGNKRVRLPYFADFYSYRRLDPLSNTVAWRDGSNDEVCIKNFDNPDADITRIIQPGYGIGVLYDGTITMSDAIGANQVEINHRTCKQGWQVVLHHVINSFHCYVKPLAINTSKSVALCSFDNVQAGKRGVGVISLKTGLVVHDLFEDEPGTNASLITSFFFSPNGRWIAADCWDGKVFLWEVRGFDLDKKCTLEDRLVLQELNEMYRIGQERNKKYNKNFVIRLNPEQWEKFQELLRRPECEVPADWARLFRPMEARHYSGQRSADVVAQNRNS